MLSSRQDTPYLQSDFYKYKFYKILRWTIGSLFIMFILLALVLYLIFFQPAPKYYANTVNGRILTMPQAKR